WQGACLRGLCSRMSAYSVRTMAVNSSSPTKSNATPNPARSKPPIVMVGGFVLHAIPVAMRPEGRGLMSTPRASGRWALVPSDERESVLIHLKNKNPVAITTAVGAWRCELPGAGVGERRPADSRVRATGRVIPARGDGAGEPGHVHRDRPYGWQIGQDQAAVGRARGRGETTPAAIAGRQRHMPGVRHQGVPG